MNRSATAAALTLGLGACLSLALAGGSPAAPRHGHKTAATKPAKAKTAASSAQLVAAGKKLAVAKKCNTCHGADYKGKPHFSPSLRADGALKVYNAKTFARVLDTGVTYTGGHVKPPMPVYHLPAKDSAALYAFLKTQK